MEAAQACLSLHLSKCHIVGNHMSRLICQWKMIFNHLVRKFKVLELLDDQKNSVKSIIDDHQDRFV